MFEVDQSWQMPVNLAVLVIFLICIAGGWKKGLLRSVLSLVSMFLSIWLAWHTKEIFSSRFAILPDTGMKETLLFRADAVYAFFNQILWFLILFVIFRILFFLLDRVLKRLRSVNGIRQISEISGGIFGAVQAVIWCLLLCVIFSTPLFHNGTEVIGHTSLGVIRDLTTEISENAGFPVLRENAFSDASVNMEKLTDEEKNALNRWLDDNGYREKGKENK